MLALQSPGAAREFFPTGQDHLEGMQRTRRNTSYKHNSFRVEANMSSVQEASSALEDLKRLIETSDWALGGLVVIGIFCLVFVGLLLFAAIFGCCSSPRYKAGYK